MIARTFHLTKYCYRLVMFIALIFSSVLVTGQEKDSPVRVKSYCMDVEFYPRAEIDYAGLCEIFYGQKVSFNKLDSLKHYPHMKCNALMTIDFGETPCQQLEMYLSGELRVHEIRYNDRTLQFTQQFAFYPSNYSLIANKITISLPECTGQQTIDIKYAGMFNPSYVLAPSNYMRIDEEGAYLRGYGYSLWFPVLLQTNSDSHKVDFEKVTIKTKKNFVSVFVGDRLSDNVDGELRIAEWKATQVDLMDVQISIRPYIILNEQSIYLYYLDAKESQKAARDILDLIKKLLIFYSTHFKEIRTSSQLHIAELPNYASGISSSNMIGITSGQWRHFSITDEDLELEMLIAHELVHPFVQSEITRKNPLNAFVTEGLPSYFHLHALADIIGEEWYQTYMVNLEKSYLTKKTTGKTNRGGPLPEEKPICMLNFNDIGMYKDKFILNDRVGLFLNYLRNILGKSKFKSFTQKLSQSHELTLDTLKIMILSYTPGIEEDLRIWLETNEYPERFHLVKEN